MIKPTHIAECLIAEMYNRSREVRRLFGERVSLVTSFPDGSPAVPDLQLATCGRFRFDGAHKIDIAILDRAHSRCIPCEVKLGNDRLGKTQFEQRFMECCQTSHKDTRISGSMIAILERKLPRQCLTSPILVDHEGREYKVASPWVLILRKAILDSWVNRRMPPLSTGCTMISFETIVDAFGGKKTFNSLVGELVTFDYYDAWMV
jgi:hypothetical protein